MTVAGAGRTLAEVIRRIEKKTVKLGDCWLFQGALAAGYGQVKFCSKMVKIHRVSAAYYLGMNLYDSTQQANHKVTCVNKNCWNPDHLYVGTQADNVQDTSLCEEARGAPEKTHCLRGHEYTEENTYRDERGKRSCKECRKEAGRQYRELHRVV